ncbi:uncharacterized protein LOC132732729 [Ruditapes philippinarum]|uniref:uncharacterized protein LOC132732729 n=1 Tax=Ruditapes philippinarum TaxID=129788 RepID=UPI00295A922F|nr:uncharacterized protein LOC132732729 [Ruditapes philippinarum]
MAEESKDIKKLIKLQKQRPAFSRMISWEISQAAEYQPVKKGKRKKKKTLAPGSEEHVKKGDDGNASPDDIEETVDDSSEYETACEEEGEIEVRGQSVTESEDQLESIGSDILDSYLDTDCENEEDEEDELFMSCIGNDTTAVRSPGEPDQGRRRRPSKKQKRKRRDQAKVIYLDDLFNLGNLFDATDEISDVFTEVLAAGPDVEIQHRVPTLVELCLKTNRRKHRYNSEKGKKRTNTLEKEATILPYGMKKLISQWGWSQKQLENQLSFFLNKVLPLVENQMKAKAYVENSKSETDSSETPKPFFSPKKHMGCFTICPTKEYVRKWGLWK